MAAPRTRGTRSGQRRAYSGARRPPRYPDRAFDGSGPRASGRHGGDPTARFGGALLWTERHHRQFPSLPIRSMHGKQGRPSRRRGSRCPLPGRLTTMGRGLRPSWDRGGHSGGRRARACAEPQHLLHRVHGFRRRAARGAGRACSRRRRGAAGMSGTSSGTFSEPAVVARQLRSRLTGLGGPRRPAGAVGDQDADEGCGCSSRLPFLSVPLPCSCPCPKCTPPVTALSPFLLLSSHELLRARRR
jgi:hypothetical protein